MLNPTCPQCNTPIATRDAMLVMGQIAIWLQCEQSHDVVEIVPVSRFNPGFNWQGYEELCQETEICWQKFLALVTPETDLMAILHSDEMTQFKRVRDIANAYYDAWQKLKDEG